MSNLQNAVKTYHHFMSEKNKPYTSSSLTAGVRGLTGMHISPESATRALRKLRQAGTINYNYNHKTGMFVNVD